MDTKYNVALSHTQKLPACNSQCVICVNHELVLGAVESRRGHRKPSYQTWEKKRRWDLGGERYFKQKVKMHAHHFYTAELSTLDV